MDISRRILAFTMVGILLGAVAGSILLVSLGLRDFVPIVTASALGGGITGLIVAFAASWPPPVQPTQITKPDITIFWRIGLAATFAVAIVFDLLFLTPRVWAIHGAVVALLALILLVLRPDQYLLRMVVFALLVLNGILTFVLTGAPLLWWEIGFFGAGAIAAGFVSRHKDLVKGFLETYDRS
jgi:hypothetical protein